MKPALVAAATALAVITLAQLLVVADAHSILDFGAIANASGTDLAAARTNGKAFYDAVAAANASATDRNVTIPDGVGPFVWIPYKPISRIAHVTIVLDGVINFWEGATQEWTNSSQWGPTNPKPGRLDGIDIDDSEYVTLTSTTRRGQIWGNGLRWWWENILVQTNRPNILGLNGCSRCTLEYWHMYNSPRYHLDMHAEHSLIQYVQVQVDVDGQRQLLKQHGQLSDAGIPTFPLNTDGLDISGKNITIRRCHIENFDDALCAKPSSQRSQYTNCTQDLLFEDSTITNGVGATIGSVPPSRHVNCVRNVIFRNISFKHPVKAIYVKPNPCPNGPAVDGTGIIDNILYENLYADAPLWWSIYVGTQQQHQPGSHGTNTGCSFFFPLPGTTCPTQPCVPVTNLKLRNVHMENALLSPGMMRCDPAGPCTGWEWENVNITSLTNWPVGDSFLCSGIDDAKFTNVFPKCVSNFTMAPLAMSAP